MSRPWRRPCARCGGGEVERPEDSDLSAGAGVAAPQAVALHRRQCLDDHRALNRAPSTMTPVCVALVRRSPMPRVNTRMPSRRGRRSGSGRCRRGRAGCRGSSSVDGEHQRRRVRPDDPRSQAERRQVGRRERPGPRRVCHHGEGIADGRREPAKRRHVERASQVRRARDGQQIVLRPGREPADSRLSVPEFVSDPIRASVPAPPGVTASVP